MQPYQEQLEAVEVASSKGRGTISMVTGFGKSVTIALLVQKLQVKTLIVVPNLGLKTQLSSSFKSWFGATPNIVIENIDSRRLKTLTGFDALIIDEAHHVAASTYRKLNKTAWSGIYYRFFFTATPFRSNSEENMLMQSIAGQVIYEVDYRKAVGLEAIVPLEAYYVDLPKQTVEGYTWREVYSELVVNNEALNLKIANLLDSLQYSGKSTLCLVKEIKQGEALSKLTGIPFANGQDGESEQLIKDFNSSASGCLIATTGVCGEGVDTKPCEYVIIAGLGKSKNAFMQQVGRAFRRYEGKESAKVIIFRNPSHKWTRAHFRAQVQYLRDEYGVIPTKINLT